MFRDPANTEVLNGKVTTNEFGAFNFDFAIPEAVNLGECSLSLTFSNSDLAATTGSAHTHNFKVHEVL